MKSVKRIILNTGILYTQLLIGVVLGLFTTRIVLGALGETNYGIYMLVAGVVSMLGILELLALLALLALLGLLGY